MKTKILASVVASIIVISNLNAKEQQVTQNPTAIQQ